MKNIKYGLMKLPKAIKPAKLSPQRMSYVASCLDLGPSICFDLTKSMVNRVPILKPILPQYFPFKDLFFVMGTESYDDQNNITSEDMEIVARLQVRDGNMVRITTSYPTKTGWMFLGIFDYSPLSDTLKTFIINKNLASKEYSLLEVIEEPCRAAMRTFSWMEFQRDETTALTGLAKTKVKPVEQERYISYMLDLTKPMKKYTRKQLGGTHASPIEHERRGHWRTYKSGKRTFVESTTINKGKGGKVDKGYIV